MEYNIKNTTVHYKECIGCKAHKKDVMVSFQADETENNIHDVFMTNDQAKTLVNQINTVIILNESGKKGA